MTYLDLYFLELFLAGYEPFDEAVNRTWCIVSGPDFRTRGGVRRTACSGTTATAPPATTFGPGYPASLSQIRLNVRQARLAIPWVRVLVGFWRERDPASRDRLRRTVSANVLVTSLNGALGAALTFLKRVEEPEAHPAIPIIARSVGVSVPA